MRKAFIKALLETAKNDKKIFLITGDLGFNILEEYSRRFPKQFLNIGVAEANMMTFAAGLSTMGFKPVVYSIATFVSMRPYEQIRNDICLQNLNVKIVGIGGGLTYTKAGPTHHSMEDIAIMRCLPNIIILAPRDPEETYYATLKMMDYDGPAYLRIERNPDSSVHIPNKKFTVGRSQQIIKGKNVAIIATGAKIYDALDICEKLHQDDLYPSIYAFPTIRPLDKIRLKSIFKKYSLVLTIEEHKTQGGFGTAIEEYLCDLNPERKPQIVKFGLKNSFSTISGSYSTLLKENSLLADQVAQVILDKVSKHKM